MPDRENGPSADGEERAAGAPSGSPGDAGVRKERRGRWRRPNASEMTGKRRHRVEIKLTDAEYVKVKAAAAVQRCSMPAVYTRSFANDGSMAALHYQFLRDDLYSARRLMVQVSNNLNQAVRLAHIHQMEGTESPRQFEADLRIVVAELEEVIGKVTRVVDGVDRVGEDRDDREDDLDDDDELEEDGPAAAGGSSA